MLHGPRALESCWMMLLSAALSSQMGTKIVPLTLVSLASLVQGIDDEFPGFVHFRNWPGPIHTYLQLGTPLWASGAVASSYTSPPITGALPGAVMKNICAADPLCTWVHSNYALGNFSKVLNTTYDMYIGVKDPTNETAPGAACSIEGGGKNFPDTKWLTCSPLVMVSDENFEKHIITFAIPPTLVWQTCFGDPKCFGFRIKNDRSLGDILHNFDGDKGDIESFKML
jgi:hypothetical protein